MPVPLNTPLALGPRTFYFRTRFEWNGEAPPTRLQLWAVVDDGAILYLNGKEALRLGMPPDIADCLDEALSGGWRAKGEDRPHPL